MSSLYKIEEQYNQGLKMAITFYIGKSAAGNFEIIDISEPDDIWFHINNDSSAHVIAKLPADFNKKDLKYIIKHGAVICKQNSKYKTAKVPTEIIYTKVKNIEKTNTIGSVHVTDEKIVRV